MAVIELVQVLAYGVLILVGLSLLYEAALAAWLYHKTARRWSK
ncbi:hypothetical protein [Thermococcus aciditolerans]|nr:hypothetical protein [Thermococcus aciditolerans]